VDHVKSKEFILNAASHYSGAIHWQLSELQPTPVSAEEWDAAIHKGIKEWKFEPQTAKKGKNATQVEDDC
jgi:hypothetical protein